MELWWLIWEDEGFHTYAVSFDHEPTNQDRADSCSNGFSEIGPPTIKAKSESEAIKMALAFEYADNI